MIPTLALLRYPGGPLGWRLAGGWLGIGVVHAKHFIPDLLLHPAGVVDLQKTLFLLAGSSQSFAGFGTWRLGTPKAVHQ